MNLLTKLSNKGEQGIHLHTYKANTIKWYSDGSKTDKGTASGMFGTGTRHSKPIGSYSSVLKQRSTLSRYAQLNLDRTYRKLRKTNQLVQRKWQKTNQAGYQDTLELVRRFCQASDENPEHLTSKCRAVAAIRSSHFGETVQTRKKYSS